MKMAIQFLVSMFAFASAQANASTCSALEEAVKADSSSYYVKTLAAYECGPKFEKVKGKVSPVNGCLLYFESSFGYSGNFAGAAYTDSANKLNVNWMVGNAQRLFVGHETSGKAWCGDINTYARTALTDSATQTVEVERARAYDNLFCPGKTYVEYKTTCKLVQ